MKITRVGDHFPDPVHNSQVLPIGSALAVSPGSREMFTLTAPNCWEVTGHAVDSYYLHMVLLLRNLPGAEEVELPQVSANQWRWQLRDAALSAAERNSVSIDPVLQMCREFDAPAPLLTPGQVVSNGHDLQQLPVGSIYYIGHPDRSKLLTVWQVGEMGRHARVLGSGERRAGQPVTVHSLPDFESPEPEPPADDKTWADIALRAWRVGRVFKKRQAWCSVFESTLASLGINDKTVVTAAGVGTQHGPGDTITWDQVRTLPEGSLLWWRWRNKTAAAVYVRDDRVRNRAGTRRAWGYSDDEENSHDQMTVVKVPSEPIAWNVQGALLAHMPHGTRFFDQADNIEKALDRDTASHLSSWNTYAVREWVA